VIAALFDLDPNAPIVADTAPPDTWEADRIPGEAELLVESLGELAQQPVKVYRAFRNLVPKIVNVVRRTRDEELDVALPLTAPRLSMNRSIGPPRSVALSSVSLDDVKAVKNALGVTVNDVVLTITTGALRSYLDRRRELPDRPLVASIPTSVR